MTPINLGPVIAVLFRTAAQLDRKLADKEVTVTEAIDIAYTLALASAREAGISDRVIATLGTPEDAE